MARDGDRVEADGDRTALVPVRLSAESDEDVAVTWSTQQLTATDGEDYRADGGQVVIPAGATSAQIPVTIIGDDEVDGVGAHRERHRGRRARRQGRSPEEPLPAHDAAVGVAARRAVQAAAHKRPAKGAHLLERGVDVCQQLDVVLRGCLAEDLKPSVESRELLRGEHVKSVGTEALQQQPKQIASGHPRRRVGLTLERCADNLQQLTLGVPFEPAAPAAAPAAAAPTGE